jgi:hypothetical protein
VAADRRPIDPPPIIQLVVKRRRNSQAQGAEPNAISTDAEATNQETAELVHNSLQNPYYFMYASLSKPDEDVELHWLKVNPRLYPFTCIVCKC